MSLLRVNLAAKPFLNLRPVRRLAAVLWLLALAALAGNLWLYKSYFSGSTETAKRLDDLDQETRELKAASADLEKQFAALDVGHQNEQVHFLNEQIRRRTFSWSRLFERLSDLVPSDVRLTAVAPAKQKDAEKRRKRDQEGGAERMPFVISGEAKSDEAILALVDAFFASPSFANPDLHQETHDPGLTRFDLSVDYLPQAESTPKASPPAATEGSGAVAEAPAPPAKPEGAAR
ncbi:MAG: hypothetical protein U0002_03960 [Thermoanaerobaculia bacterium]